MQNEKPWKSVFEGAKTEKSYELAEAVQAKLWVTNLEYFFVVICLFPRKILHFSGPIFAALLFTLSFRDTQTKCTLSSPSLLKKALQMYVFLNTRKPMIEHWKIAIELRAKSRRWQRRRRRDVSAGWLVGTALMVEKSKQNNYARAFPPTREKDITPTPTQRRTREHSGAQGVCFGFSSWHRREWSEFFMRCKEVLEWCYWVWCVSIIEIICLCRGSRSFLIEIVFRLKFSID